MLEGRFLLQVEAQRNIAVPRQQELEEDEAAGAGGGGQQGQWQQARGGSKKLWKLALSDGHQTAYGVEWKFLQQLRAGIVGQKASAAPRAGTHLCRARGGRLCWLAAWLCVSLCSAADNVGQPRCSFGTHFPSTCSILSRFPAVLAPRGRAALCAFPSRSLSQCR